MESLSQCDFRYYPQCTLTRSDIDHSIVRYPKALYQSPWCQGDVNKNWLNIMICNNTPMKTTNLIINLDHDDWILNNENENLGVVGFGTLTPLVVASRKLLYQRMRRKSVSLTRFNMMHIRKILGCGCSVYLVLPQRMTLLEIDKVGFLAIYISIFKRHVVKVKP